LVPLLVKPCFHFGIDESTLNDHVTLDRREREGESSASVDLFFVSSFSLAFVRSNVRAEPRAAATPYHGQQARSMAPWVQVVTQVNHVRHFVAISRAILVKGAGPMEIAQPFLILVATAAVLPTFAVRQHHKVARSEVPV
jgi:hypothetical protein